MWAGQASNINHDELTQAPLAASGASATSGLQISNRSALGSVSHNVPQILAGSQSEAGKNEEGPSDKVHKPSDFQLGTVFSAATDQRDFFQELEPGNIDQSMSRLGIVHSKYRKCVVIARFATHVIALPIYTHGGQGLANKWHKDDFVSVRDVDLRIPPAGAESIHT